MGAVQPLVVGLGDSVTAGVGDAAGPGGELGWAAHVAAALGFSYLNVGRIGARAAHVRQEQLDVAVAARPAVALILVGGNDVLRMDFDPLRAGEDLDDSVAALQAAGSTVVVVRLHDPRRSLRGPKVLREVLAARVARLDEAFLRVIARRGCLSVDTDRDSRTYDPRSWHIDRMHPGPAGHRLIAELALAQLAGAGFRAVAAVDPSPVAPPRKATQMAWLVTNGTPWFIKRSVDLIPGLVVVVLREWFTAPGVLNASDYRRERIREAGYLVREDARGTPTLLPRAGRHDATIRLALDRTPTPTTLRPPRW